MMKFSIRAVAAALALDTVSTPAEAYGWGHGWGYGNRGWGGPSWGSSYHEHHYYRGGGGRRGSDSALVFGIGALLGAGVALAVSNNSRSSYSASQITYVSPPVYAPAPVIYQQPVYVAPPVYQQPIYAAPTVSYSAPTVVYNPPVTYVTPSPVQVVQPSQVVVQSAQPVQRLASADDIVAYPASGQDGTTQMRDREACRNWAMNQSGFDPAVITAYTTTANTESYHRALGACLKGKGYSIN